MRLCTASSKVVSNIRTASSNEVTSGTVSAKGGVKKRLMVKLPAFHTA